VGVAGIVLGLSLTRIAADPITIITGKGTHSIGGIGVLGPAVRNALSADGWSLAIGEGSLTVRGRLGS
jgi:hypothetical protein